jgi:hypothetical protein
MAESTLSVSINTLYREVGHFMGWGRDVNTWTTDNVTDFGDIVTRGLRQFYFPPTTDGNPLYEWSFLRKVGTVVMNTNTTTYVLPDDFAGTILDKSVTFGSGITQRAPQAVDESVIRKQQAMSAASGAPKYYAVRTVTPDAVNGHRWEMVLYPTPTSTYNNTSLSFVYPHVPNAITNTNIYPLGGAQNGEVILAAIMASAEYKHDDDPAGPFFQRFMGMLPAAIRLDQQTKDQYGGDQNGS